MRLAHFLACGALIVAGNVFASASDYVVTVQQEYKAAAGAGRVAIIPFACPEEVDCDDLEKRLAAELADRASFTIMAAAKVRKVMTKAGIEKFDNETGHILAESLAVDAFVVLEIQQARIEETEEKRVKHVMLRLQLVSKDGAVLLAATAEAHVTGMFTSLSSVVTRAVDAVLEQAMPER